MHVVFIMNIFGLYKLTLHAGWFRFGDATLNLVEPYALQWRHNEHYGVSNHRPHDCLLNCLFGRRSKKTGSSASLSFCAGNSPVTGEFSAQMDSYAENVSIWWRHHGHNGVQCTTQTRTEKWIPLVVRNVLKRNVPLVASMDTAKPPPSSSHLCKLSTC